MATESFQVTGVIPTSPERVYQAWLDEAEHSRFTGGKATVEPGVGGKFTAWDGYIQGATLELEHPRRIVQSWRTSEFPEGSSDSRLEILFEEVGGHTRVTLLHSEVPEGQGENYRTGWNDYYLQPLSKYFGSAQAGEQDDDDDEDGGMEVERAAAPVVKLRAAPAKKAAKAKKKKAAPKKMKAAGRKSGKKSAAKVGKKPAGKKKAGKRGKAPAKRSAKRGR